MATLRGHICLIQRVAEQFQNRTCAWDNILQAHPSWTVSREVLVSRHGERQRLWKDQVTQAEDKA